MKKPGSKKPPKSVPLTRPCANVHESKILPLLPPAVEPGKKQPGLITSFINMVDIAEALSEADKKKQK